MMEQEESSSRPNEAEVLSERQTEEGNTTHTSQGSFIGEDSSMGGSKETDFVGGNAGMRKGTAANAMVDIVHDDEQLSKLAKEARGDSRAAGTTWAPEDADGNTVASSTSSDLGSEPMPSGEDSVLAEKSRIAIRSATAKGKARCERGVKPTEGGSILAEKTEIAGRATAVKGKARARLADRTREVVIPVRSDDNAHGIELLAPADDNLPMPPEYDDADPDIKPGMAKKKKKERGDRDTSPLSHSIDSTAQRRRGDLPPVAYTMDEPVGHGAYDLELENATRAIVDGGGGIVAVQHPGAYSVYPDPITSDRPRGISSDQSRDSIPTSVLDGAAGRVGDDENRSSSTHAEDIVATLVDETDPVVIGVATPLETTFKLFLRDRRVRICIAVFLAIIVALSIAFALVFTIGDTSTSTIVTSTAPTPEPIPLEECTNVTVGVTCRTSDGRKCEKIRTSAERCESRPFDIVMRFNGGTCKQSTDNATDSECQDFNGGPPTAGLAYIQVTSDKDFDMIYFEGPVIVGNDFHLNDENSRITAKVRVTVTKGSLPGGVELQRVVLQSSCSKDFFLSDEIGSLQVVAFTSDEQIVNRFFHATYSYTIRNKGEFNVRLVSLISARNDGLADLTDDVEGIIVAKRAYTFEENVLIDITLPYEPQGTLTAIQDVECDYQMTSFNQTSPSSEPFPPTTACTANRECIVHFPPDEAPS